MSNLSHFDKSFWLKTIYYCSYSIMNNNKEGFKYKIVIEAKKLPLQKIKFRRTAHADSIVDIVHFARRIAIYPFVFANRPWQSG